MDSFNSNVRNVMDRLYLTNEYVSTALIIFFVVYASLAAPKLPEAFANLFDKTWFRFIVFFAIAYLAKQNAAVAIVAALAVLVTIQTANRFSVNRDLQMVVENKGYMNGNRPNINNGPANVQQDPSDYRNNFYPSYVEEPVENMRREDNESVSGYSNDSMYAHVDEE